MGPCEAELVGRQEVTAAEVADLKLCRADIASVAPQLVHPSIITCLW